MAGLGVTFARSFSLDWSFECVPIIAASRPTASSTVRRGSAISLSWSTPFCPIASPAVPIGTLPTYTVPNFIGKPLTAAIAWIQHRNLSWAATIPPLRDGVASSLFANYTVTSQLPRPGKTMQLGIEGHDSFRPTPLTLTLISSPQYSPLAASFSANPRSNGPAFSFHGSDAQT
jgi:hypothetical protein